MHQCIARFRDFDIHLSGSLAAEILHWFHKMLSNAMQSRVEQVSVTLVLSARYLPTYVVKSVCPLRPIVA